MLREEAIGITTQGRDRIEGMHVDKLMRREQNMGFTLQERREEAIETGKGPGQGNGEMVLARARSR